MPATSTIPADRQLAAEAVLAEIRASRPPKAIEDAKPVSLIEHLREVDPGPHLDWWHVGAMVEACQAVLDGEVINLLLVAPPRTYKSRTVIQGTSSCALRNDPRRKVMLGCAADKLVKYHSRHARTFSLRAGVTLRSDSKDVSLWETVAGGTYAAVTILGSQLGFGWDLLGLDDPFASQLVARRATTQQAVWDRWRDDFQSRKQAAPDGSPPAQFLMHQRLARGDLVARLCAKLEEGLGERWHALHLQGFRDPKAYSFPTSVVELDLDPRQPGEPLSDDEGLMGPIRDRRANDVIQHQTIDQGNPAEDAGGGMFRRSWLPIIGVSRGDLADPVAAIEAMAAEGEIPSPRHWIRGHDFAAGGEDAVASCGWCALEDGGWPNYVLFDATEGHPPAAGVESMAMANARRFAVAAEHGSTGPSPIAGPFFIEQAIPKEAGVGGTFTARIQELMVNAGLGSPHLMAIGKGKRALAMPLAAAAAPSCRLCARLVVEPDEREAMGTGQICECEAPEIRRGKVAILAGPMASKLQAQLVSFTGQDGGEDDLVDSAAAAHNAGASISPPSLYPGGVIIQGGRVISAGNGSS